MSLNLCGKRFEKFEDILPNDWVDVKSNKVVDGEPVYYKDAIISFDIETSSFMLDDKKRACMYTWQMAINGKWYLGRTWSDFERCMKLLQKHFWVNNRFRLIIWVRNLAYEFQWIMKRLEWMEMFARQKRKPMYATTENGFEFRCSYMLSGESLATTAKNLTKHDIDKMVGDLNYDLVRGWCTPLTEKEITYCGNDVLVDNAYISEQIDIYGDITKLPLTNTGRVRRAVREICFSKEYKAQFQKLMENLTLADEHEYMALKQAFAGGEVGSNEFNTFEVMTNVMSLDETSAYPTMMLAEKYPMSKATVHYGLSIDEIMDFYKKDYRTVFEVEFFNLTSKNYNYYPIPVHKVINKSEIKDMVTSRKRVVKAEHLKLVITDVDFITLQKYYDFECVVRTSWTYKADYLPKPIILAILDFYKAKTTLKGLEEFAVEYLLKKGMLNSLYGMIVMDIISAIIDYDNDDGWTDEDPDAFTVIADYDDDKRRFTYYPWGVYVTAYARKRIYDGILELADDHLYNDTDSLKFSLDDNMENPHKAYFEAYNEWITQRVEACLKHYNLPLDLARPKTVKGEEKPIGVWDDDGTYDEFKTLGSKRYLTSNFVKVTIPVRRKNGKYILANKKHEMWVYGMYKRDVHLTVAGTNKKKTAKWLSQFADPFEKFDIDLVVPAEYSGRLTHTYIDEETYGETTDYLGNKFTFHELSSVYMEKSDFSINRTDDIQAFIDNFCVFAYQEI